MKKMQKMQIILEYIMMALGSASMALSIVLFLVPSQVPAGGPPGIAILVNYALGISPGLVLFTVNVPLILVGYKMLGKKLFVRSLVVVLLTSVITDGLPALVELPDLGDNRLLKAVYGGLVMGLGLGLAFKAGSSSGGWSTLARLIASRYDISLGHCLFSMDAAVIIVSAIVFRDFESAMLGGVSIFITGRMVDLIVSGSSDIKIVQIACGNADRLKPALLQQLGISGSVVKANSTKNGSDKEIVFLMVEKTQLVQVRKLVEEYSPDAHLIVMNAMEVYGTGMREC